MECERDKANLSSGHSKSPCSALLERLKNMRKWQDEQCKELRAKQFIKCDQASSLDKNTPNITKNSDNTEKPELNLSPKVSTTIMSKALADEDANKDIFDGNPESFKSKLLKDVLAQENLSLTRNTHLSENSYVTSSTSFDDESHIESRLSMKLPSEEEYNKNLAIRHHSNVCLQDCGVAALSQESHDSSSESPTITPSSDEEEVNINYKQILKESDDWRESKNAVIRSKVNILKYENDDMRKFHGLSNFIKKHASIGGAANSHDSGTGDYMESIPKPKFRFLRKGEGTARFGMKPVRMKSKNCTDELKSVNSIHEFDEGKRSKSDAKISPQFSCDGNGSAKYPKANYISKINNKPQKTLQLQMGSVKKMFSNVSIEDNNSVNKNIGPHEISLQRLVASNNIRQVFTSNLADYDKQGRRELEELSAFEKLEELAEDSSFSSNCSTVVHLLQRGQHSASSTPVRSRASTPQLAPIVGPEEHETNNIQLLLEENSVNQSNIISKVCQNEFPLVNVSQILEQLREIVKLKHTDESAPSEEEIKTLIESFIDSDTSVPSEFASYFASNIKLLSSNPTSTPAVSHESLPSRPRVHFRPEGVEVLEYECTDSDEENTLTDTPSIVDDTDLVTTSDLEILAHIVDKQNLPAPSVDQVASSIKMQALPVETASSCMQSTPKLSQDMAKSTNKDCLQPVKLQFSPPRQPQNSASHYIWSIFGKNRVMQNGVQPRDLREKSSKPGNLAYKPIKNTGEKEAEKVFSQTVFQDKDQQEVETCKALLMAKVCELEKETDSFKRENHKLKALQESLQKEKSQLDIERKHLQLEMEKEKRKFCEYVDAERNKLWKEKQAVRVQSPSVSAAKEQSLEIVYLKEQLHDAKEEIGKKESLHQFMVKKLNEKIKVLEEEIKVLKEKNGYLQKLEKENMHLKHELDRTKMTGKTQVKNKPKTNTLGHTKVKVKRATISSINKSLDKVRICINDDLPITKPVCGLSLAVHGTETSEKLGKRNSQENSQPIIDLDVERNSNLGNEVHGIFPDNKRQEDNVVCDSQHAVVTEDQESSVRTQIAEIKYSPRPLGNISIDCTELYRDDGTKEIIYANGNKKEIHPDGSLIINYYNGDRKEVFEDKTIYIYGTDSTRHTTYSDGKELLEFPNGQMETRFPDGSSEILFTDNTRKTLMPDGTEICVMKDGTVVRTNPDGIKVFEFISGQKEIHTPKEKRREYPDGTVKILHQDGRTETRYKKGRVRVKDKEGNIITDTHQSVH